MIITGFSELTLLDYPGVISCEIFTQGYKGMQIYGYTKIEVENNLPKWVEEYFNGGVSK